MKDKAKYGNVDFEDYSYNNNSQQFTTVRMKIDGKKEVIGRIHRQFDTESHQANSFAADNRGNAIFTDAHNQTEIEDKFRKEGRSLAYALPADSTKSKESDEPFSEKQLEKRESREKELRELREDKDTEREQEKDHDLERD